MAALGDGGIPFHRAGDGDLVGGDVAFHGRMLSHVQHAAADVPSLDGSVKAQLAFERQRAGDFNVLRQDALG